MVNELDWDIVIYEFELQSRHYIQFQTNTPVEEMNSLISPAMGWIVRLLFFYKHHLGIK